MNICSAPCIIDIQNRVRQIQAYLEAPVIQTMASLDCGGNTTETKYLVGRRIELLEEMFAALNDLNQNRMNTLCASTEEGVLIDLNVPVVTCRQNGESALQYTTIQVPAGHAAALQYQFDFLAQQKMMECWLRHRVQRSYNILGGNTWFKRPEDLIPDYQLKVEDRIKASGEIQGYHTEQGPDDNQLPMTSLLDLLAGHSSTLYHRMGLHGLPADLPESLLKYHDGQEPVSIRFFTAYLSWFVKQFDALMGQFPIEITIEDTDPLTKGNQTKKIELPNLSEAIAEMMGLAIRGDIYGDVAQNYFMRIASELVQTKNAALIAQEYAKANASFLGYKGNPVSREINYAFNPTRLGDLAEFLQESKGNIEGWKDDGKETALDYFQKLMFAAGIIKAAFWRTTNQSGDVGHDLERILTGDSDTADETWRAIIQKLNDPQSPFNRDAIPKPHLDRQPETGQQP